MVTEWIRAFLQAFFLLFIAELGDKTQLIILTLASKGRNSKKLAVGATLGFAVIVILGGAVALILNNVLDISWITLISGCVFVVIALIQIYSITKNRESNKKEGKMGEDEDNKKSFENRFSSDYLIGFLAIISMELGDKTQIMTIILAASSPVPIATLIGSWAALSSLAIIGAYAGNWLSKKVPKKTMDWIASMLFLIIGIILIFSNI